MIRPKKRALWALICGLAIFIFGLCIWNEIWRSPNYVLTHLTPPYEQEAVEYFEENKPLLHRLVLAQGQVDRGEYFTYAFHYSQYNSQEIPAEAEGILRDLEMNTQADYTMTFSDREIVIMIATGTHYDVRLCRAYDYDGGEHQKTTPLEDRWEVRANYVIRH